MPQYTVNAVVHNFNQMNLAGGLHERRIAGVDLGPVVITMGQLMQDGVALNNANFGDRPQLVDGIVLPTYVGNRDPAPDPAAGVALVLQGADIDRGHLFALCLGGPDVAQNIVPQWGQWQRAGDWRGMERHVRARAVEVMNASRPIAGNVRAPTRFVRFQVTVDYVGFAAAAQPRQRVWGFPRSFTVNAFVCDQHGAAVAVANGNIYQNQRFEGAPDGV